MGQMTRKSSRPCRKVSYPPALCLRTGAPLLLLFFLLGCQSAPPARAPAEVNPISSPELTLASGDVIEVKFFYAPELNESQMIRPDGKISLQLAGDVTAAGKTPAALRGELIRLYSSQLKKPEATVIVRSLAGHRVYVGGEVNKPGLIEIPGRMTALEAIMHAGGFDLKTAEVRNVVIIRHRNGRRYGWAVDYRGALAGEQVVPFYLEPHDIVYVPRTAIARVDQWIDQHINQIVPSFFGIYVPVVR